MITNPLSEAQRATLLSYLATKGAGPEAWAVWATNDTTLYHQYTSTNGPYTITYIGANGATTTSDSTNEAVDVAAAGLTAPVVVVLPKEMMTDTGMTIFRVYDNAHEGVFPDISKLVSLTIWTGYSNKLYGPLPDFSTLESLDTFSHADNAHTSWAGGTIPASLQNIRLHSNALNEAAVNGILQAVEANGTSNGTLYLDRSTNAVPTGAGLTAYNALVARDWDVTVNL
jgi:hypothetical protein